jgi:hypothetical protein
MILKGSQRSGGQQLGQHLLRTDENEHVEVHEVRGFMADTVLGAMKEAQALSMGTRCKQYLFSLSLSPPETENVRVEVFTTALAKIEERLGLMDQPRIVVFHEKEGRRHAHAVWSRIDADTMTAKQLSFFKSKLTAVSRELYLENGWKMPRGLMDERHKDPTNFTLAEWQQGKRAGLNPGDIKAIVQECWAVSDNRASFATALEERGLYLAKGDRRGYVALTYSGEVLAISRLIDGRAKDVAARLGKAYDLPGVEATKVRIAKTLMPVLNRYVSEAKQKAAAELSPLVASRKAMQAQHMAERKRLDDGQKARHEVELRERAGRIRKGFMGLWDRITGDYAKAKLKNEVEAFHCLQRDRAQRDVLVSDQLAERRKLQADIRRSRAKHAAALLDIHRDTTRYREMLKARTAPLRDAFNRREKQAEPERMIRAPRGPSFER